jgi:hypothetical protein
MKEEKYARIAVAVATVILIVSVVTTVIAVFATDTSFAIIGSW